jgi:hypothetical protein
MAEELVKGIKSTSKSGSPHNDSNAALVKRWFGGMAAAALILRSGSIQEFRTSHEAWGPDLCGVSRYLSTAQRLNDIYLGQRLRFTVKPSGSSSGKSSSSTVGFCSMALRIHIRDKHPS